jgi:hypothetical protein
MSPREILKREFDAEKGSFLLEARYRANWDWDSFRRLTSAMYDVADEVKGQSTIERWIAEGFWYCETFVTHWKRHPSCPRPPEDYRDAIELIHNLSYLLFIGRSPYEGDTLRKKAKG